MDVEIIAPHCQDSLCNASNRGQLLSKHNCACPFYPSCQGELKKANCNANNAGFVSQRGNCQCPALSSKARIKRATGLAASLLKKGDREDQKIALGIDCDKEDDEDCGTLKKRVCRHGHALIDFTDEAKDIFDIENKKRHHESFPLIYLEDKNTMVEKEDIERDYDCGQATKGEQIVGGTFTALGLLGFRNTLKDLLNSMI